MVNDLVNFFKLKTSQDLFYRVGSGKIENQQLKEFASHKNSSAFMNFFKKSIKKEMPGQLSETKYDLLVFGKNEEKLDYKLANCCNPIPGDQVFGFVTINEGIKVHKIDCPNAISLQSNYAYRILPAKWIDSSVQEFNASLMIKGIDGLGLTNELTRVISNQMNVNIQSISLSSNAGIFNGQITVIVPNNQVLNRLIENIQGIDGVEKITRILGTA